MRDFNCLPKTNHSHIMKRYLIIFLLSINVDLLFAQDTDWRLWTDIGVEKKLSKQWTLGMGAEYRWKNDISNTDQIRGSADVSYRLNKYVKFGVGYELIADKKLKKDVFVYRNRFVIQATGSHKYARFTASWRPRLQTTILGDSEASKKAGADNYNWVLRNRFGLKYNIRHVPLNPYVNFEIYNRLFSDFTSHYKNRFGAGIEFNPGKHHSFDLGYKFDSEVFESQKYKFNIINIGYTFSF